MSKDPAKEGGGINLNAFVSNNAINQFDILGLAIHTHHFMRNAVFDGGLAPDVKANGSFEWGCSPGGSMPVFGELKLDAELEHSSLGYVTFFVGFDADEHVSSVERPLPCEENEWGGKKRVVVTWHIEVIPKIGIGVKDVGIDLLKGPILIGVGNSGYEIDCCCRRETLKKLSSKESWEVKDWWKDNKKVEPTENPDPNGWWPDWIPPAWTPNF